MLMVLRLAFLLTLILSFALVIAKPMAQGATDADKLFSAFIEAMNTKDEAKLKAFIVDRCSTDVPVDQRVERLKDLVEQGAPFKLVKVIEQKEGSYHAVIEDMNAIQLDVVMQHTTTAPIKLIRLNLHMGSAAPTKDYSNWTDLGSLLESIRKDNGIPAIGIAVFKGSQLTVETRGVRELGKEATVTEDEPWSIGSIGKPICSTIIGKLIEEGKLHWDTTLGEALKDFPMDDGYKAATLEQIMHHRGGIPQDMGFNRETVERIVGNETDPTKVRERYAKDILSRKPASTPGTEFAYSNAGYALLSVIAERAEGKPYEQLVRDMIFTPLGLKHSFIGTETLPENRPSGHVGQPGALKPVMFKGPLEIMVAGAGGGMWMSVADLAIFAGEHLKGLKGEDGLLKAEIVARLHQGADEPSGDSKYACGWGIRDFPKLGQMQGHNGSNGTFRAEMSIFPKMNLIVIAIINAGGEKDPSPALQTVLAVAAHYAKQ